MHTPSSALIADDAEELLAIPRVVAYGVQPTHCTVLGTLDTMLLLNTLFALALSTADPVGFIGLGIMGQGMARRLLSLPRPLHVWSRNHEVTKAIAAQYPGMITIAASPAAVIDACERTYLMLSTPEACEEVYTMESGVLEGCRPGKAIIDCATLRPEDMASLGERVRARGGSFVEAPVSGSKAPAANGALIFMCAGDKATFEAAEAELGVMGKKSVFCSETVGAATQMKLVVNLIMGTQLAALAEGLVLADKLNLSSKDVQTVLDQGAMASPMVALKGPLMAKHEYSTAFPLKYALKDMRFALSLEEAPELPVSAAAAALYAAADDEGGLGDADFCAVMEAARGAIGEKREC